MAPVTVLVSVVYTEKCYFQSQGALRDEHAEEIDEQSVMKSHPSEV